MSEKIANHRNQKCHSVLLKHENQQAHQKRLDYLQIKDLLSGNGIGNNQGALDEKLRLKNKAVT